MYLSKLQYITVDINFYKHNRSLSKFVALVYFKSVEITLIIVLGQNRPFTSRPSNKRFKNYKSYLPKGLITSFPGVCFMKEEYNMELIQTVGIKPCCFEALKMQESRKGVIRGILLADDPGCVHRVTQLSALTLFDSSHPLCFVKSLKGNQADITTIELFLVWDLGFNQDGRQTLSMKSLIIVEC